jgi:hypothetical protein
VAKSHLRRGVSVARCHRTRFRRCWEVPLGLFEYSSPRGAERGLCSASARLGTLRRDTVRRRRSIVDRTERTSTHARY